MREEDLMNFRIIVGVAILACLATGTFAEEAVQRLMLPAGSLLRVRLKTTLSDKTNKNGDPFTAMLFEPVAANGEEVLPAGSMVTGHVAFVKESGRVKGVAEMRLVADTITLPEGDAHYNLAASLDDAQGSDCLKVANAEEGKIKGCGKSAKNMLKNTAIGAGAGAAGGLMVGMATRGGCSYYYGCYPSSGPGVGTDVMYGAGLGAGTALIYSLFKHNKHIILVQGAELTFIINRSVSSEGDAAPAAAAEPAKGEPPATDNP
jgi:hypothetical protein